jgi:DNA-binding CsgD family transcriptional regulator
MAGTTRLIRRAPSKSSTHLSASVGRHELTHLLLGVVTHSTTIGFAVCDERLQFQLVNDAWSMMDGVTHEAHLGEPMRKVLGSAADKFELAFKRVFSTGKPFLNYEFSAKLPTRTEQGYWVINCFPINDSPGKLKLAAAVVLESTQLRKLQMWSQKLLTDSVHILEVMFANDRLVIDAFGRTTKPVAIKGIQMEELTPRELEVIQLLARSKSNKEAAEALRISVRTVETYRARIMLKLRIRSLSELVHYAIRNGIVEP